ncbi:MAG: hypothetical protein COA96_03510 [SAR86 cluster bacterium]|uniref:Cytochrome b561 bacterial/Ni-hydrogenase domain-containing protein n=1 Tax=SAR86 cluster bacterium TaxID=2030880 RepID=A0A2A5B6U3_9GAMM|nr:MAG: hypothetical protein COA96_03510 [SAR86 cluster bacterium]
MTKHNSLYDQADSFGWISIGLHWATTIAVLVLWFVGQSILSQAVDEIDARRSLHITIGLIVWLPIAARIVWRLRTKHPQLRGQTTWVRNTARAAHYLMLAALSVMLVSGPTMAWMRYFSSPEGASTADIAFVFHSTAAMILAGLVSIHILGALKHLMFHDDETVARIFVPRRDGEGSS